MSDLSGMTGFARLAGGQGARDWLWEVKSVNGKGLDVRMRLPAELSHLELPIKKIFARHFSRGNMQLNLAFGAAASSDQYTINEALLDQILAFAAKRGQTVELSQVLQVRGVVSEAQSRLSEDEQAALEAALLKDIESLCDQLQTARRDEGAALAPIMLAAVEAIEACVEKAEGLAALIPSAIRDRLTERLKGLEVDGVSEERIAQEVAFLAQKADIREELDRLKAHCDQARSLLAQGSPIGRKLDFLAQEFNREANTLCSKSSDIDLTQIGLAMKSVIEQFREQAANVE